MAPPATACHATPVRQPRLRAYRTVMPSNVAVASCVLSWLVTARPMYTSVPIVHVSLPMIVHETPSAERDAVITLPRRSRRSHAGAVPVPPLVLTDRSPVANRR